MKSLLALFLVASALPAAQPPSLPLWPNGAPGAKGDTPKDQPFVDVWLAPQDKANGAAFVVAPGGGYGGLAVDHEGVQVAKFMNSLGVSAFVLHYRLGSAGYHYPIELMDVQRAIRFVRSKAGEYALDANRVGIIGFSAGGTVAASVAHNYTPESRPNFVGPIYLQYEWSIKQGVPADAPPMFLLAATDDPLGLAPHSVALYRDWTAAGKSAELHLFAQGGHGFGMRKQQLPADHWIERFAEWMGAQGFLKN